MTASKARIAANAKYYKKTYDRFTLLVRRDAEINADFIKNHAISKGESTNAFILRAIKEAIERDNQ